MTKLSQYKSRSRLASSPAVLHSISVVISICSGHFRAVDKEIIKSKQTLQIHFTFFSGGQKSIFRYGFLGARDITRKKYKFSFEVVEMSTASVVCFDMIFPYQQPEDSFCIKNDDATDTVKCCRLPSASTTNSSLAYGSRCIDVG